jgi:hypothetical protein
MSLEDLEKRKRGPLVVPKQLKPNTVYVIGDVHGNTGTYRKYVNRLPEGQLNVQIGDMGIGFSGVGLPKLPDSSSWFRGNHDNPEKCRKHPNYRGDFGYDPNTGIFHIAGAFSIDRAFRVEGKTFWSDEELSYQELQQAIDLYIETKPKYVLSHEAPAIAAKNLLYDLQGGYFAAKLQCSMSRTSEAMQMMLAAHTPDEWVFGHYHVSKSFKVEGYKTKFTCVGAMFYPGDLPHVYELEIK